METPINAATAQLGDPADAPRPVATKPDWVAKKALLETIRAGASEATPGPSAARSQDFLFDKDGLPAS